MTTVKGRVLVDTSAWIEFFRDRDQRVASAVDALLEAGTAVLAGPVLAELTQGARSRREQRAVARLREVLEYVESEQTDWETAGRSARRLRRDGQTIPLIDTLLATVARRHRLPVLTTDKHFERLGVELIVR
jgi:predicted nucleic acid-binding protein